MLSIFPCYATRDKPFALDLAAFLERGAGMQVFAEDGEIGRGENIVSKAADGLEAEVILLVLSPRATPARWVRTEWEPALREEPRKAGVKVGTILVEPCEFPQLLGRDAFFDATRDRLAAFREIKRWLLGLTPPPREAEFEPARQAFFEGREAEMEILRQTLADAPGAAMVEGSESGSGKTTLALEFARQSKRDFEGLVWLSCSRQSLASLAGEMGSQLGMQLEGDAEQNVRDLTGFCAKRRILVVLDDAPEEAGRLIAGGSSSTLLTTSRADLFAGAGAVVIPIDPLDQQAPRRVLAGLGPEHLNLLAAACACGDAPYRRRLLAELAAGELLDELIAKGMVIQLDARHSLCSTYSLAREAATPSDALARAHAHAVNRLFADWAREDSECEADLPQLRRALEWTLSQEDRDEEAWVLACELAKRGVALLKRKGRQVEAYELLDVVSRKAEERGDRRMLEDCSRDQIWILESWDRTEEARRMRDKRRAIYEDQMRLDFV